MAVWMNGDLLPDDDARVSVFDHGLVVGDGVFETIKVAGGVPFAMTRHLARLRRSALGLGLPEPDLEAIHDGALAVISASGGPPLARLRVTVTGGKSPLGSERGDSPATAIVAMATQPSPAAFVDVVTVPWPRNERGALSGLKTTSYGENVRALSYDVKVPAGSAEMVRVAGAEGAGTKYLPDAAVKSAANHPEVCRGYAKDFSHVASAGGWARVGITYRNPDKTARFAVLRVNDRHETAVAFPPTGVAAGEVTVQALLDRADGGNAVSLLPDRDAMPVIESITVE